ncbi:MAG: flagellar motor switch protein FliN [Sulfurimonas sp. RIFOXYD12_FULL_33_39]|uniref:flagellar motor switch protein FliY n=1 Tax=unclassified Sulfurimonas TaxID=2623549 RepID=UPI0008C957E1|nr:MULTISPECIES: flagellar motor switch protein FliY [unclassified Sulfurimonas]OHE07569.1 MAG: flagellar motor switch protein FliN [Sulfurimonas sp. RIFCSPLOWO2_12_FULL_34_6]OHE10638.1 MAG: flagellar motor switch protein FliN [Sulfurimonas sp. RIFOXYD12_FULL_33_39]OHE13151.1 MAG: flagellar motor switch protein FliN [Sulfurimonas sp. RIFOXYD2_FULL_34_21]
MNDFMKLFENETVGTIEALIGQAPTLELKEEQELSIISNIIPPIVLLNISISGDLNASAMVALTPSLVASLSDMMMGEENSGRDDVSDDDLDAAKEITSNIFGAISNSLGAQKELPALSFSIDSVKYVSEDKEISLENYSKMFIYNFQVGDVKSLFMFIMDENLENAVFKKSSNSSQEKMPQSNKIQANTSNVALNSEEMSNIALIMDVKLPVKVRIGKKKMLLKDVLNMDIGSVVELNQLANDPLEILVDDHVIAEGEVVIVDGNFGVQITTIGTKRERLNQLKG